MDWERIMNWINHFGISVNSTHVSGHASGSQLKEFVEQVDAKNVIPLHTENARAFEKWSKNVTILGNVGASYTL
jgi:mRNA degradation ribonuclease J1/J2